MNEYNVCLEENAEVCHLDFACRWWCRGPNLDDDAAWHNNNCNYVHGFGYIPGIYGRWCEATIPADDIPF